jgi:hypothetical protein
MDSLHTGELAEPRSVEADNLGQEGRIGDEALDGIVGRGCMCWSPLVPVGPVDLQIVLHLNMMSQARQKEKYVACCDVVSAVRSENSGPSSHR